MPNFNGTGPMGQGSMTGRGLGNCGTGRGQGGQGRGRSGGLGMGRRNRSGNGRGGRGFGRGQGRGLGPVVQDFAAPTGPEEVEAQSLRRQAEMLEDGVAALNARIAELEGQGES